jgi:hypothetical protein
MYFQKLLTNYLIKYKGEVNMLKIRVLGKGLIPRINVLAPRKDPFYADLTLIQLIMNTPGLEVEYINPDSGNPIPLTRENMKRVFIDYGNRPRSVSKPVETPVVKKETKVDELPKVNDVPKTPEVPVTPTTPVVDTPVSDTSVEVKKDDTPVDTTVEESKKDEGPVDDKPADDVKTENKDFSFKPMGKDNQNNNWKHNNHNKK